MQICFTLQFEAALADWRSASSSSCRNEEKLEQSGCALAAEVSELQGLAARLIPVGIFVIACEAPAPGPGVNGSSPKQTKGMSCSDSGSHKWFLEGSARQHLIGMAWDEAQLGKIFGPSGKLHKQAQVLELAKECGHEPAQIVEQVFGIYQHLAVSDGSSAELMKAFQQVLDHLGDLAEVLEDSTRPESDRMLRDICSLLRWDFSKKVLRLKLKVDASQAKARLRGFWEDQCRLAEDADWLPDSEVRLEERLAGFVAGPEPQDDLDKVMQLVCSFENASDDEKVAFFLLHFKQELFALVQQKANHFIEEEVENMKELDGIFEVQEQYYKVLVCTASLVAQCYQKSRPEARAFLFGHDWDEMPIEKLRAKKSQLLKSFHTDKTKTLAWRVRSIKDAEGDVAMEEQVQADLEKFTAATALVSQVGKDIEQEREKLMDLRKRMRKLEGEAKVWMRRAEDNAELAKKLAKKDASSLHQDKQQDAAKRARELWDDLMRLLDREDEPDEPRRIRVRLSIAEACVLEGLPANIAQLYVIGAKHLWHRTWPLDQKKQQEHNVLLKAILEVEQKVHAPGACASIRTGKAEAGHVATTDVLALLPTACRGQRLRSDLQVATRADLDKVFQSTMQFDMDAYQLMVPTLEVARCDVSSPMCRTLKFSQTACNTLGGAGLAAGAGFLAVGSLIGCAVTGGAGILLLTIGGVAGLKASRQASARGSFLKQLHHIVRESYKALQSKGAEAFLETLCMPLPNSGELGGAAGKQVLKYPHTLEEPLKDLEGSVKFLLEWSVCPVFIGQLLLQVAEIFASRRIKQMKLANGEAQVPMYNRLKIQAENILNYLEKSVSEGDESHGDLYQAALDLDAQKRTEDTLAPKKARFQTKDKDGLSLLEECFVWSTTGRAWCLKKQLPERICSTASQIGMTVQKATLYKKDGSALERSRELKDLRCLTKLFVDEADVCTIELELSSSMWACFNDLASFFVKDQPAKDGHRAQLFQLLQITRINMAMLLLLNQEATQEEDGNIKKAELILQKVLKSVQASTSSYDLEIRVKAVQDFFQVFAGRELKMLDDGEVCPAEIVRYEQWSQRLACIVEFPAFSAGPTTLPDKFKSLTSAFLASLARQRCKTSPATKEVQEEAQEILARMKSLGSTDCDNALRWLAKECGGVKQVFVCKPPGFIASCCGGVGGDRFGQPAEKRAVLPHPSEDGFDVFLTEENDKWCSLQLFEPGDFHLAARELACDLRIRPSTIAWDGKGGKVPKALEELAKAFEQEPTEGGDRKVSFATELLRIHTSASLPGDYRQAKILMTCLRLLSNESLHATITDDILNETQRFLWFPSVLSKIYLTKAHSLLSQGLVHSSKKCADEVGNTPEFVESCAEEKEWLQRLQEGQRVAMQHCETPASYKAEQPKWGQQSSMGFRCKNGKALYNYTPQEVGKAWRSTDRYNILSVDGRGIQDVMPAVLLSELELRLHKPLHQVFQLMAGTSTGSLIIGGLATPTVEGKHRYSACDIVKLYVFRGKQVVPQVEQQLLKDMTSWAEEDAIPFKDTLGNIMVQARTPDGLQQRVADEARRSCPGYKVNLKLFDVLRSSAADQNPLYDFFLQGHEKKCPADGLATRALLWAAEQATPTPTPSVLLSLGSDTDVSFENLARFEQLSYHNPRLQTDISWSDTSAESIAKLLDRAESYLQEAYCAESNWFNKMIEQRNPQLIVWCPEFSIRSRPVCHRIKQCHAVREKQVVAISFSMAAGAVAFEHVVRPLESEKQLARHVTSSVQARWDVCGVLEHLSAMKLEHVLAWAADVAKEVFSLFVGALGHGALTKPLPRLVSGLSDVCVLKPAEGQQYCPWCVGEHQPARVLTRVFQVRPSKLWDARFFLHELSAGDAPYPGSYSVATAPAEPSYTAGGKLEANIVLDADHNGDAIFDYCPHSEAQTDLGSEECFRSRQINDWTDVHAYWDASNTPGRLQGNDISTSIASSTAIASAVEVAICKYTDEIFVSCVDLDIVGGVATTSPECIWTEPAGRTVERASREVYYQSKTDIYHMWNSNACCLSAAESFGSDVTGNPNLVVFTPTVGTFGFCECTAWDPSNPGTCAGAATSDNMICPVLGASKEMCSEAASWDGLPVGCTPVFSTTPSATATTTMAVSTTSPTDGCCYWDANKGCEGSGYCWESKANCEGSCNGNWKANTPSTMAPTTVPPTTTVAPTPAPVYTTTTTVTTTTTPMPTTTTTTTTTTSMPSTTPASSDSFEPVDGGEGRACRGAHAGDNDASYFTTVSGGVDSLDECKAHCLATAGCHGIENIGRRCEIWTHPVGASISLDGYVCLRVVGGTSSKMKLIEAPACWLVLLPLLPTTDFVIRPVTTCTTESDDDGYDDDNKRKQ
ncbi:Patatin-like protein 1 [Symbiodinium microadriaticum]|uniref:Patatin-like protein 1 n=1 Tax=Symbiodinium microadriaticum TaxID=2951 RepID=A0A1Q9ENK3_SYMMI|nr:Patatin-like protein 1 [Symbiodinium microadriaticum]